MNKLGSIHLKNICALTLVAVILFAGALSGYFYRALPMGVRLVLFGLARKSRQWSGTSLLLAGITLSFFCSAMIMFIQYTATYQESFKMVRWLMGTMDFISWEQVLLVLPFVAPSIILLTFTGPHLNLLSLGAETAASSGVDVKKVTLFIFLLVSLSVASTVAIAGPIAFVAAP